MTDFSPKTIVNDLKKKIALTISNDANHRPAEMPRQELEMIKGKKYVVFRRDPCFKSGDSLSTQAFSYNQKEGYHVEQFCAKNDSQISK